MMSCMTKPRPEPVSGQARAPGLAGFDASRHLLHNQHTHTTPCLQSVEVQP